MQILVNLLLLIGLWYCWPQQNMGVIDHQLLVATQAKIIAKDYPKGVPSSKLQQIAARIKDTTINYAKEHKLLLIAKNAVWDPELPDHTDNILKILREQ